MTVNLQPSLEVIQESDKDDVASTLREDSRLTADDQEKLDLALQGQDKAVEWMASTWTKGSWEQVVVSVTLGW